MSVSTRTSPDLTAVRPPQVGARPARERLQILGVFAGLLALLAVLACVHVAQGTAHVGPGDLLRALLPGSGGAEHDETVAVLVASRLPRLGAALLAGIALGVAGTALQSVTRNPLATPDTLAVNAGAYAAVVAVASFGVSVPFFANGLVAFVGGLLAAGLVLLVANAGTTSPMRLVLAGSAVALALSAFTTVLLTQFPQDTVGLFAWGAGSTVQSGPRQVQLAAPLVAAGVGAMLLLAHRLDLLGLGDDSARVLGIAVGRTRVLVLLVSVLLAATSVTVTGPIGFVGLCAPVVARLIARRVPGLPRHLLLLPLAALLGAVVIVGADVLLRLLFPSSVSVAVPTGILTTLTGAAMLVWLARGLRGGGPVEAAGTGATGTVRSTRWVAATGGVLAVALVAATVGGLLLGDRMLLLGDVSHWWHGTASRQVAFVLDQRWPRVAAALLGGAALALAGAIVQAVCRNPLAEPSLLGVTPGASVGAIAVVLLVPGVGIWPVMGAATVAALATFALIHTLAVGRGSGGRGLASERLVLMGVGVGYAASAVTTLIVVLESPWNTNLALTWLSGSTYGRTAGQLMPVALCLIVALPIALLHARTLDVVALGDDVPRVLGVPLDRARAGLLAVAAVLTASAACAVGALGFVGLAAPHAARALVGARHARSVPIAVGLGALLVSCADTLGRTVFAPAQLAAGLVTALIGAPYFVWLLWRTRPTAS